jgi:rSAM/selenodomain-associated transferase 1
MTGVSTCTVAVFAKAPVPGAAKTRLIPELGAVAAARLHLSLVQQALETALAADVGRVELWWTQPHAELSELAHTLNVEVRAQCSGELGSRMADSFDRLLAQAPFAILVGSDCPARSAEDFRNARAELDAQCHAVFGPTEDGGYHLIALRDFHSAVFRQIDWGTERVMQQTRSRVRALGWRWHELPMRWDVDRPADLDRLRDDAQLSGLLAHCQ